MTQKWRLPRQRVIELVDGQIQFRFRLRLLSIYRHHKSGQIVNRKSMSREYWEQRYQTRDMPWEKGAPSPGLVDFLAAHPDLPRGTVCVPGCGTGHDVREFAKAGFARLWF